MKYSDIINTKYPFSKRHKKMSLYGRAGQFAAFAALTGYDDIIDETSRRVDDEIILNNDQAEDINRKLVYLIDNKNIFATYMVFKKDSKKKGGKLIKVIGSIKKLDIDHRRIILNNDTTILIDSIKSIII